MTNQTPNEFKPSLPYTTYNDKGEPVMDIKAIKSGKQKAAKKRPYADRGNPSPDTIIHSNQPSSKVKLHTDDEVLAKVWGQTIRATVLVAGKLKVLVSFNEINELGEKTLRSAWVWKWRIWK